MLTYRATNNPGVLAPRPHLNAFPPSCMPALVGVSCSLTSRLVYSSVVKAPHRTGQSEMGMVFGRIRGRESCAGCASLPLPWSRSTREIHVPSAVMSLSKLEVEINGTFICYSIISKMAPFSSSLYSMFHIIRHGRVRNPHMKAVINMK